MAKPNKPVSIGISACMMGEAVRYDGRDKRNSYCVDVLARRFTVKTFCPEVGIGLGVPRAPIRLVQSEQGKAIALQQVDDSSQTHHQAMQAYFLQIKGQLDTLSGYVLMQKSPSCGLGVAVFDGQGQMIGHQPGLFATMLKRHYPLLPLIESCELEDIKSRRQFMIQVQVYSDWQQLTQHGKIPASALMAFHRQHKFLIQAHSESIYRKLGPLVAMAPQVVNSALLSSYEELLMQSLAGFATAGTHLNVMLHLFGMLKSYLNSEESCQLMRQIDAFRMKLTDSKVVCRAILGLATAKKCKYVLDQKYLLYFTE